MTRAAEENDFETAIYLYERVKYLGGETRSIVKKLACALAHVSRKPEAVQLLEEFLDRVTATRSLAVEHEVELRFFLGKWCVLGFIRDDRV